MASQDSKISSTSPGSYNYFGNSVGISGINNNTYKIIVGAYNAWNTGNVFIFSNTSTTTWSQTAVVSTSNIEIGDNFGYSVDISENDNRYIVGAPYKDNNKGRVYVYNSTNTTIPTELFAPNSGNFGFSVALNGDGTKAIVGAPYNDSDISGNAYTYSYSSSTWSLSSHLYPSSPSASALFGYSVHISNDGSRTIVGEPYENAENHGAAYIFNSSGNQEAKLSPSDTYIDGNFGYSVNIDSDGNTAVIGSIGSDNKGAAYVFTRSGTTWTQEAKLVSSDITTGDKFGYSVCISNDGNTVLVSTPFKSSRGAVYVFIRTGGSTWSQRDKILSDDLSTGDNFGNSLAISPNNLKTIIGAYKETPSNIVSGGSVYSYTLPENYNSNINRITHTEDPEYEDIGTFETFNLYINGQPVENKPTTWPAPQTMNAPSMSNIFFGNVEYSTNLSTLEPISDIKIGNFTLLERNVYDTWDNTPLDFYEEGPPNQMLSVGGEAIIEQKLGIGIQTPVKPLHVLGDIQITDQKPTNTSVDISSKSSIFKQTFELEPISQKTYEVHGTFFALSSDGTTAAVTSYTNPPGNDTYWYVYIYNWNGSSWEQNAVLQPDIIVSNDQFGNSTAFSSDGNTIVIGAYEDESVYVFSRSGFNSVSWSQVSKIKESVSNLGNQFGYSVDINGEGSVIVVGSPKSDNNKGSIYVYTRSTTSSWNEAIITGVTGSGERLGEDVSITSDGNTILGTAVAKDLFFTGNTTKTNAGAAYIWKKSGSTWSLLRWWPSPNYREYPFSGNTTSTDTIFSYGHSAEGGGGFAYGHASNDNMTRTFDRFGKSCDISDDGNTIIIGAPGRSQQYYYSTSLSDYKMGSVYIFKYKYTGETHGSGYSGTDTVNPGYSWVENAHIQAPDWGKYDYFGSSVSLSSDGNTAIIGSPGHDSSRIENSGAIYIFTYSGLSWSQQYKITPPVPTADGTFGQCVCLSSDGLTTITSSNALNVFKPIDIIDIININTLKFKYESTNFKGEFAYQQRQESDQPHPSIHNDLVYNPYTKTWSTMTNNDPSSASFGETLSITSSSVYAPYKQVYNPIHVYIWLDYGSNAPPNEYLLFEFINPYYDDSIVDNSNVYTYSLPEDYSKQYINTLNISSNLYVNENIITPNKVGINTDTPEKELHVKGDIRISDESENVDFNVIKKNVYEESFLTLPLTGEDAIVSNDNYGKCVCISGDGSTVAIASHHSGDSAWPSFAGTSQSDPGKLHIYTRNGNKWTQQVILQPDDVTESGHFGEGLSLSQDGTTLAVGAYNTNVYAYSNTYTNAGAVYIYSRSGRVLSKSDTEAIKGTWTLENKVIPPVNHIESNSFFGYSVSLNNEGNIVLITAKNEESNKGAFYTYAITETGPLHKWDCMDRISGSTATVPNTSAIVFRAKISGNGLHCVVSEIGADNSGVIKFYTQYITGDWAAPGNINGNIAIQWELVETITAPANQVLGGSPGITQGEPFGMYLAIDEIGNAIAISIPYLDLTSTNTGARDGAVLLYTRSNGSAWVLETILKSDDSGGSFGHDIQLSSDGKKLVIGQPTSNDSVYMYEKIDSEWILKQKLTPSSQGIIPTATVNIGTPETHYGYSISMTSNGDRIIVGDHKKTINNQTSAGACYIYNIPIITDTSLNISNSIKTDNDILVHKSIGLGTDSPEKKLHVLGDIRITNTDDIDISVLSSENKVEQTIFGQTIINRNNILGRSMSMTQDGNTIAFLDSTYGGAADRLYLFKRSGMKWHKQCEYIVSCWDFSLSSYDGKRVAFRGDKNTVIINTINPNQTNQVILEDSASGILSTPNGNTVATDPYIKVKISGDSNTLLVSYPEYELTPLYDSVSSNVQTAGVVDAYSYSSSSNKWTLDARLRSNNPVANAKFGNSLAITNDGNRVFVGFGGSGTGSGDRIEIFSRVPGTGGTYGGGWSQLQTIYDPTTSPASTGNSPYGFGARISVASDGRNVALSSPWWHATGSSSSSWPQGGIYIYYWNGSNYNTNTNTYEFANGAVNEHLGWEIDLSGDGRTLLVTTRTKDSNLLWTGNTYVRTEISGGGSGYQSSPSWTGATSNQLVPEVGVIAENFPLYGNQVSINHKGDRCAVVMSNGGGPVVASFIDIHNLSMSNETTLNISKNLSIDNKVSIGSSQRNRGQLTIYEEIGSSYHSHNQATLVLEHGDSGGSSCILFPSARNLNSDYGYIQYEDSTSSGDEKSRLIIGTENDGPGGNQDLVILKPTAAVGIGTNTPGAYLDVNGYTTVGSYSGSGRYFNYNTNYHLSSVGNVSGWGLSIRASNDISSGASIFSHGGTWTSSDSRIKTNINDVTDASALEKIRLLEPKTYKYIDTNEQGDTTVYGFIAQEVSNVFPEAVKIHSKAIPNIYELSNVSDSNVITFTNFNTTDLLTSNVTSKIEVKSVYNKTETLTLDTVIDAKSIRVKEDLTDIIGSIDDTGNVVSGNQVFVMGQEVDNFNTLKKEYIFTIATAALQEVDRQLQAEKTKVATLETQVADLLARVTALENN